MKSSNLKETAKMIFWVKGHIWPCIKLMNNETRQEIIDSYVKRLWHNEEAYQHFDEEGFERAWKEFNND